MYAPPPKDLAQQALLRFRPDQVYDLSVLSESRIDGRAVFRARPQGAGQVIVVKVGAARPPLARQFRRQRQMFRALLESVPRPLFLDPDLAVMGMSNAVGRSFRSLWSDATAADLSARAGAWLAAFHRTSQEMRSLQTAPMLRWLDRIMTPDLQDARTRLTALAERADAIATPHAIIHGDFHAANLILAKGGQTVGFDFENVKHDLCLRDVFFFLTDTALRGPSRPQAFLAGYGALDHSTPVLRFLDSYLATTAAARTLRSGQVGQKMQARLNILLPIALGQCGLLAPQ